MKIGAVMFFTADSMHPAALGRALDAATRLDPRRTGVPSTKGII